jgi:hypothetical protein
MAHPKSIWHKGSYYIRWIYFDWFWEEWNLELAEGWIKSLKKSLKKQKRVRAEYDRFNIF